MGKRRRRYAHITDFGAKGDGIANDDAAFILAAASQMDVICVPKGSWTVTVELWEKIPESQKAKFRSCEGVLCKCQRTRAATK